MPKFKTANDIRQSFIDFFVKKHGHTFVPSSSLVPGGDATLLFTNSGMVQFKDVFLGTDKRPYLRAVNSQKSLRVAGKHNDLEDVGTDDTHHTFFEMLGNWSFGDYYKKEAIAWHWELLTKEWGLSPDRLYATVFKDDQGDIPTDDEAAQAWLAQPGFDKTHLAYYGRKDNFWEMAETGPCGPNSEIHIDLGPEKGEVTYLSDGQIDFDGPRFVEICNLVFIQYNRTSPTKLDPLPAKHVDTGMGFERIVSVLEEKDSNYRTSLFLPIINKIQELTGENDKQRDTNFTPYRVIADHSRAATFLIADGVVPGNIGRNYVARMIIRRAARFGTKLGLNDPFLAKLAEVIIDYYGDAYPELVKNRASILDNLTREEERFQRTVESGITHLEKLFAGMAENKQKTLAGDAAFELYATYGLPFELTRDIAKERDLLVDEAGFHAAMDQHRLDSGAGQAMGELGGEQATVYADILKQLQDEKKLDKKGIKYDPYDDLDTEGELLALVQDGKAVKQAKAGDRVGVLLPETAFYVASGGQISDTGEIHASSGKWKIRVTDTIQPAAGAIVHIGEVVEGEPKVGDKIEAQVDVRRRQDIMRNHTATHLLHAALHKIVSENARQAGSLVAPDRLRFDFTHPQGLTKEEISKIEEQVNAWVLDNHELDIEWKSLDEAKKDGAMALFGEKYGAEVRTVAIGEDEQRFSYELCGGTHVEQTGDIGVFIITSEGSAAAGIRRIEAVTGRAAYNLIKKDRSQLREVAALLSSGVDNLVQPIRSTLDQNKVYLTEIKKLNSKILQNSDFSPIADFFFTNSQKSFKVFNEFRAGVDKESLMTIVEIIKSKFINTSVMVISSTELNNKQLSSIWLSSELINAGFDAGKFAKFFGDFVGGKGGGSKSLAQVGGGDPDKLKHLTDTVIENLIERTFDVELEKQVT